VADETAAYFPIIANFPSTPDCLGSQELFSSKGHAILILTLILTVRVIRRTAAEII
jgi:hypothetical protein